VEAQNGMSITGLYRAQVVANVDPQSRRRLQVKIPMLTGDSAVWAEACVPSVATPLTPVVGKGVWVMFEAGDLHKPVWVGVFA
jgi:hypothetical protein